MFWENYDKNKKCANDLSNLALFLEFKIFMLQNFIMLKSPKQQDWNNVTIQDEISALGDTMEFKLLKSYLNQIAKRVQEKGIKKSLIKCLFSQF